MMQRIKYQDSWPCGFRQEYFSCFPIQAYVKHVILGLGHFRHWGHNLNNFGIGPLDDACYIPNII